MTPGPRKYLRSRCLLAARWWRRHGASCVFCALGALATAGSCLLWALAVVGWLAGGEP